MSFSRLMSVSLVLLLAVCVVVPHGLAQGAPADPCTDAPGLPAAKVVRIDRWLDLHLAGGTTLHLSGIWAPSWHVMGRDYAAIVRADLQRRLMGQTVTYAVLTPQPDRWRRLDAAVFAAWRAGTAARQPVQQALLAAGLVQVHIGPVMPCLMAWRAAEQAARDVGAGLWADDDHAEVDPALKGAFDHRAGHEIVVRGRVYSVETKGYRTYIRFGPRRFHDFEVSIIKPDLRRFSAAGMSPQALKGHVIRVRGRLSTKFGPQIEVARPQSVEITDTSGLRPVQPLVKSGH